jgi:DnaK suppressor protein
MSTARRDARLRTQLEVERSKLVAALAHYEQTGHVNIGLGNHMADDGTEAFEQAASMALRRNQERQLRQVEKALCRMNCGTFGHCERCGDEIDFARLKAIPYTTYCIGCQPRIER